MIIKIVNLKIQTIIGVGNEERANPQEIGINLTLTVPDETACSSDNISHTVNYDSLSNDIIHKITDSNFFLIERVASEIKTILRNQPLISKGIIEIMKPGAVKAADNISVIVNYEK